MWFTIRREANGSSRCLWANRHSTKGCPTILRKAGSQTGTISTKSHLIIRYISAPYGDIGATLCPSSRLPTHSLWKGGIDRNSMPPTPSIQIEKDLVTGEPTGALYEFTYKPLVEKTLMKCIPRFTLEDRTTARTFYGRLQPIRNNQCFRGSRHRR